MKELAKIFIFKKKYYIPRSSPPMQIIVSYKGGVYTGIPKVSEELERIKTIKSY